MLRIGYRAHDFGKFDSVEALAERLEALGEECFIQLALNKVVPTAKPWQKWDEEYIASVTDTLLKHGVSVGIVGCYIQPTHIDEEKRKSDIMRFKKSLSLTKAFKCDLVATETGTRNPDGGYSVDTADPKYIELFYSSLSEMVDAAEKYGSYCVIEGVSHQHTMSSPERMKNMLDKFKSERLKVLFDPINMVPYTGIPEKDGVPLKTPTKEACAHFYNELLDIYGDRLVAMHCKDYILSPEDGHKIGDRPALTGVFDWAGFIKEIRKRNIDVPWSLENLNPETCLETKRKLESFYNA